MGVGKYFLRKVFRLPTFIFSFTIGVLITNPKRCLKNIDPNSLRTGFSVGVHRYAGLGLKNVKTDISYIAHHRPTFNLNYQLTMVS